MNSLSAALNATRSRNNDTGDENNDLAKIVTILSTNLPQTVFIGKDFSLCYTAHLNFSQGYIPWNIDQTTVSIKKSYLQQEPLLGISVFYPDFFRFTVGVDEINTVCKQYLDFSALCRQILMVSKIVIEHFRDQWLTGYNFLRISAEDFPSLIIASDYQEYKNVLKKSKDHPLAKEFTFLEYLRTTLFGNAGYEKLTKHSDAKILQFKNFMSSSKLSVSPSEQSIKIMTENSLHAMLADFDKKYDEVWKYTLQKEFHALDLEEFEKPGSAKDPQSNEFYAAFQFGNRCQISYLAAYRFLKQKQREQDPAYRNEVMRQARLNALAQ